MLCLGADVRECKPGIGFSEREVEMQCRNYKDDYSRKKTVRPPCAPG